MVGSIRLERCAEKGWNTRAASSEYASWSRGDGVINFHHLRDDTRRRRLHAERRWHVLTDNGSCFTPAFEKACAQLGAEYRHTRPRTPQTNGMVERFNGRIGSEVLGITIYSHRDLEQLLRGFNAAYNTRRQRVLDGKTPDQVVAERLEAQPNFRKPKGALQKRASPCDITKARLHC
jgi:transposase InsO family protein